MYNSWRDGNTQPPYLPPEKPYAGQDATVSNAHGTTDWFQIGKECVKAVYCHPAYLTYMQSSGSSSGWSPSPVESFWSHGLWFTRLLCPWDSPGKNTGVDCHSLLQRIFLTQGLNLSLLHYRQILYHLSYREVLSMQSTSCEMLGWVTHKLESSYLAKLIQLCKV